MRRYNSRFCFLVLLGIPLALWVLSGRAQAQQHNPTLTNADVVSMSKAGLGQDVILAKIESSSCDFDTSPAALERLRAAGVPDAIILAMVKRPKSQVQGRAPQPAPSEPTTKPSAAVEAGATKPVLVVRAFQLAPGLTWPYDMKQLKSQTIAELKIKDGEHFRVIGEPPGKPEATVYTLHGEVVFWHAGNRAQRMLVGLGSGRETAKIHYWLVDENGKRIFDHVDTIRQAFWGNAYANSVGQLAQPFADKIAKRLAEAKLF